MARVKLHQSINSEVMLAYKVDTTIFLGTCFPKTSLKRSMMVPLHTYCSIRNRSSTNGFTVKYKNALNEWRWAYRSKTELWKSNRVAIDNEIKLTFYSRKNLTKIARLCHPDTSQFVVLYLPLRASCNCFTFDYRRLCMFDDLPINCGHLFRFTLCQATSHLYDRYI